MIAAKLSERERDVLALMAEGLTHRQIASRLNLEQSTVRWYARQIYARLGAENRQEALARALELGLVAGKEPGTRPPHNLPASATPFVGRTNELTRLSDLLADPAVRIITVIGPGGMGKTRLVLAAAERQLQPRQDAGGRLTHRYSDGIWLIPLAAVDKARLLVSAFAEALGLQLETETGREPPAQLLDYLRQKRALLVVDNFEHLAEEASFLSKITAAAIGIQLLVTSRERLQLPGEQVFPLDGLETPGQGRDTVARLSSYAAAQLFLNTARRVQPDLTLREADGGYIARICQAVAGMPLGIELAASWVSALPLGDIAREIEGSLELLAADWRGMPERHRSLQAALEASWQRLGADQQAAFEQLCVFRGGFTRPAAFEVAGATLPLLVVLLNKCWLTYDSRGDRYHIHELLRQYGQLKLAADPHLERAARGRHSAYHATYLQQRAADFTGARQRECVSEIQAELANVQQAWDWAVEAGDAAHIGQCVESLARFYEWMGRLSEGEAALRAAAERLAALAQGQPSQADVTRLWAVVLIWQSRFTTDRERQLGLLAEAQALLERWPADQPELRAEKALLLLNLGDCDYWGERQDAARFYEQALELYQGLGDRAGMAACINGLGAIDRVRGRLDQAAQRLEASLSIRRESGDQRGVAGVLDVLGLVRKHQGQAEEAERLHREVVELYRRMGSRLDELAATQNLAHTLATTGRYDEMLAVAQGAMALARELGDPNLPYAQNTLASALKYHGRYEEARVLLLEAATTAREAGLQEYLGIALCWLGEVTAATGDYSQAEQWLIESANILAKLQHNIAASPLVWLSYTARAQANAEGARRRMGQALRLMQDRRSVLSVYECLPVAALLAADRGAVARAAELHALSRTFPNVANSRWVYDTAGRQLDEVVSRLPAEVATAAIARGRTLDLWQTLEALAAEFTPG